MFNMVNLNTNLCPQWLGGYSGVDRSRVGLHIDGSVQVVEAETRFVVAIVLVL